MSDYSISIGRVKNKSVEDIASQTELTKAEKKKIDESGDLKKLDSMNVKPTVDKYDTNIDKVELLAYKIQVDGSDCSRDVRSELDWYYDKIKDIDAELNTKTMSYSTEDENGKKTEYQFFIDRNGDGKYSSDTELLGGGNENQAIAELKSYDQDDDGYITLEELKNAEINGGELKVKIGKEVQTLGETFGALEVEIELPDED